MKPHIYQGTGLIIYKYNPNRPNNPQEYIPSKVNEGFENKMNKFGEIIKMTKLTRKRIIHLTFNIPLSVHQNEGSEKKHDEHENVYIIMPVRLLKDYQQGLPHQDILPSSGHSVLSPTPYTLTIHSSHRLNVKPLSPISFSDLAALPAGINNPKDSGCSKPDSAHANNSNGSSVISLGVGSLSLTDVLLKYVISHRPGKVSSTDPNSPDGPNNPCTLAEYKELDKVNSTSHGNHHDRNNRVNFIWITPSCVIEVIQVNPKLMIYLVHNFGGKAVKFNLDCTNSTGVHGYQEGFSSKTSKVGSESGKSLENHRGWLGLYVKKHRVKAYSRQIVLMVVVDNPTLGFRLEHLVELVLKKQTV